MKRNEAYDPVTLLIENDAYNVLNIRSGRCSQMTGETPSPPHIYDEPMFLINWCNICLILQTADKNIHITLFLNCCHN